MEGFPMGIAIEVNGLTKSFGSSRIWEDVTLDIPAGEVSVLLGPSGTGKSVFLKSLIDELLDAFGHLDAGLLEKRGDLPPSALRPVGRKGPAEKLRRLDLKDG